MSDTNDIRDEFSPLLDDELTSDARDAVEAKLAQDSDLLRELDAMRKVDSLYRGLPPVEAPSDMAARVRDQLNPKTNVVALRPRGISRKVYSGLAVAAMFGIMVGGVVIRQTLVESPQAEDNMMASAPSVADIADDGLSKQGSGAAFGDERSSDFAQEVEAETDRAAVRERDQGAREMPLEESVRTETRTRRESFENAPAAETVAQAMSEEFADKELKGEAAAKPKAAIVPAPPPATPSSGGGVTAGRGGRGGRGALGGIAPTAVAADADSMDAPSHAEGRLSLAKKRDYTVERIAGRVFEQRADGWYERGYNDEPTKVVPRDLNALAELVTAIPNLRDILQLKDDIVLKQADKWYRILAPAKK